VAVATPHKTHGVWPWLGAIAGLMFFVVMLSAFAVGLSNNGKGPAPVPCANPCKNPPPGGGPTPPPKAPPPQPPASTGPPVAAQHTYQSSAYGYQVQYYDTPLDSDWMAKWNAVKVVAQDDKQLGFVWDFSNLHPNGDPWFVPAQYPVSYLGVAANGQSAQQIATSYMSSTFPGAQKVYDMPAGTGLGFTPGYGAVYQLTARTPTGETFPARIAVIASVKGNTGVIFSAVGYEYRETAGHPNPADTIFAHMWGPMVNQVVMPGDQPL
jgi:hypothetical protein